MATLSWLVGAPDSWKKRTALVAIAATAAVASTLLTADVVFADPGAAQNTAEDGSQPDRSAQGDLASPDAVTAQINAKLLGERVEDLSQRTETSSTYALPDGSWEASMATGQVWVQTGGDGTKLGDWAAQDSSLRASPAGGYQATAHAAKITVSGATNAVDGRAILATATDPESSVVSELTFPGDLPEPVVAGPRATYKSVLDGLDLVVEVTGTGVEQFFVLSDNPSEEVISALVTGLQASADQSSDILAVTGEEASETAELVTENGDVVASILEPLMWDAAYDAQLGDPITKELDLDDRPPLWAGTSQGRDLDSAGAPLPEGVEQGAGLIREALPVVQVDGSFASVNFAESQAVQDFLNDKGTQYPVVIDPSVTLGLTYDTYVRSDTDGNYSSATELLIGTYNGGAAKTRSFLNVNTTPIKGKKITSATLKLFEFHSWSCAAAEWQVWSADPAPSNVRWSTQPTWWNKFASTTQTKGFGSACDDGWVTQNVTPLAQAFADNSPTNQGFGLRAASETDNKGWKRFYSGNSSTGKPTFTVTYNSYPNTPSAVSFASGQSVKDSSGKIWVRTLAPQFRSTVTDPDGGKVKAEFDMSGGSTLTKAAGSNVASKSVSTYAASLQNGKTYTVKTWANDGSLRSKKSGPSVTFTVDTSAPSAPTVASSGGYSNSSWKDAKPSANIFTFSSSADTSTFQYQKNSEDWKPLTAASGKATLGWNPTGSNVLRVKAIDKATNTSATTTYAFGNGSASLSAPKTGATTSDAFRVVAGGPSSATGAVTPKVYWREANTESADKAQYGSTSGWYEAASLPAIPQGNPVKVDTLLNVAAAPANKLKQLGKERVPALVEVQVCFDYAGAASDKKLQCTTNKSKNATAVTKLPHAFGGSYPIAEAGSGQVALATGELNISETDVTVDAGDTDLSVSRTYSSYSGIGANSKIFGQGWRANIDGPDEGLSGLLVAESTALDGTITLIHDDETAAVFRQPGNGKAAFKTGTYSPANEEATASGWKVALAGAGSSARITITEEDNTVTSFIRGKNLEDNTKIWEWTPDAVTGGSSTGTSRFVTDTQGRITTVISGTEQNLECGTASVRGCRILNLSYDGLGRVSKVAYTAFDQDKNTMNTINIAEYGYDGTGTDSRLSTVTDSRTGDVTSYTYGSDSAAGVPLLASTEERAASGERLDAPTYYEYGKANGNDRSDWLQVVKRGNPVDGGGKHQVARFVYGVTPNGNGTDLPSLSKESVALWAQDAQPVSGYAVFGQGKDIGSSKAADVPAGDWKYGDLSYVDSVNRVVNTSEFAAGGWQSTAAVFNDDNNIVRSYDARGLNSIKNQAAADPTTVDGGTFLTHTDQATITTYHSDDAFFEGEGAPKGTTEEERVKSASLAEHVRGYVAETWSPTTTDENGEPARVHTRTEYTTVDDIDAGGMPRMLVMNTTVTQSTDASADRADERVISASRNSYDAFEADGDGKASTDKSNKRSGWVVGSPTTVSTVMGDGQDDIQVRTWFDDKGRIVKALQPESSGVDAGTLVSTYYSSGTQTANPECGNRPELAGYLCLSQPQGEGSVSKHQTRFNIYGQASEFIESSTTNGNTAKRTTTQSYRADGQELVTSVTAEGLDGSTPVPAVEKLYNAAGVHTGAKTLASAVSPASEVSWETDLWGRIISYTNSLGEVTTTEYDAFGNTRKVITPLSTNEYWYGALSGDGNREYQGVVTKMTISNHGGQGKTGTYTASYDGDGNLLVQTMPGGFAQVNEYDPGTGKPTGLSYTGPLKGEDGTISDGTWVSWSTVRDVAGRIVGENTPDGDLLAGVGTDGDRAAAYDKSFEYDRAGRLVGVTDVTADVGTQINHDPDEGETTPVVTRRYDFDKNGNRVALKTQVNEVETASRSWSYDTADRVGVNEGYMYDGLGRQSLVPAADAPGTASASIGSDNIAISYYDDDSARSVIRAGVRTSYGLDPAGRRAIIETSDGNASVVNHYADASDNPAWSVSGAGDDAKTTRYESTIGGDLAVMIIDGAVKLAISNPHGDVVTTVELGADDVTHGVAGWAQYDEFGNLANRSEPANTGANTYGWHGADERALDLSGLILMGARLYNSATGLFTSRDPVDGGNSTTYVYPQDPIGMQDTTGKWGWVKNAWGWAKKAWSNPWVREGVLTAVGFIPGLGVAAWAFRAYRVFRGVTKAVNTAKTVRGALRVSRPLSRVHKQWSRSSFPSSRSSFAYHYGKHGGRLSASAYHRSAKGAVRTHGSRVAGSKNYGPRKNRGNIRWDNRGRIVTYSPQRRR